MNATLTEALTDVISSVTQAKDFILEQAPDVVQQLLAWELWSSLVLGTFFMVLSIFVFVCVIRTHIKRHKINTTWDDPLVPLGYAAALVPTLPAICEYMEALKVLIAPKLYLIEYAARLAQGATQ